MQISSFRTNISQKLTNLSNSSQFARFTATVVFFILFFSICEALGQIAFSNHTIFPIAPKDFLTLSLMSIPAGLILFIGLIGIYTVVRFLIVKIYISDLVQDFGGMWLKFLADIFEPKNKS